MRSLAAGVRVFLLMMEISMSEEKLGDLRYQIRCHYIAIASGQPISLRRRISLGNM